MYIPYSVWDSCHSFQRALPFSSMYAWALVAHLLYPFRIFAFCSELNTKGRQFNEMGYWKSGWSEIACTCIFSVWIKNPKVRRMSLKVSSLSQSNGHWRRCRSQSRRQGWWLSQNRRSRGFARWYVSWPTGTFCIYHLPSIFLIENHTCTHAFVYGEGKQLTW